MNSWHAGYWRPSRRIRAALRVGSNAPETDLALASDVLARLDRDRAMAVAYEAGYRACAGLLDLSGYRVTSQPGHHRAAIEGAGAVLDASVRPLLRRLDAARRFRNETLYGDTPPAPEGELRQLLSDVDDLLERLSVVLSRGPQ